MVIQSVATLLVNLSVWPFTAPLIVENSPANEQVDIVTTTFDAGIVADPNELANVQPGGGAGQLVHCTVVVRQVDCVPQVLLVLQCAKSCPVKVFTNDSGVCPKATTGPDEEPERIVIQSVATLLVNCSVWPFTAPLMVENSPANEQVEIVTTAFDAGIVAVPKALPKRH